MSKHRHADDGYDLEPPLVRAVQAVLAQAPGDEAVARVMQRAKRLEAALPDNCPATPGPAVRPRALSSRRFQALSASGATAIAAAVLLAVFLLSDGTSVSWAEMWAAVGRRPWVHGITTYSDGQRSITSESWVSTARQIAAFKLGDRRQFDDLAMGISLQYDAQDGEIYQVPALHPGGGQQLGAGLPALLDRLIADKADSPDLFHGERIVKAERHLESQDGKRWLVYLIHLERIDNPSHSRTVRIRLDRDTQLPQSWDERRADGSTAVTRFDYPDSGPRNIFDLGVPETAKLVDRIPNGDLARILKVQRADRQRFDAYDAIVVQQTEGVTTNYEQLMNLSVKRVRRKGEQYRVDQLLVAKPGLAMPAPGTDMQEWWKENRDRYWSVPQLVCDGRTTHFYKMLDDRIVPGKGPNLSVVANQSLPRRLPIDDSPVEWPQLMPEQCSRPHLWVSDKNLQFDVDASAADGPQGAVRIIVTKKSEPRSGELFRYWFDPDRDFVLRKEISAVFDSRTNKLAYLDTEEYDDFAQSPDGKWYPRLVRRTTSNQPGWQGVTRFFLDFDGVLDSALFQPELER